MNCKQYLSVIVSVVIFSLLISPVEALINVEWTVDKVYGEGSKAVMIGKVVDVVAEKKLVNITLTEVLKGGKLPFQKIRLQVLEPQNLIKEVQPDQPFVFFLMHIEGKALVHIANTWLKVENLPNTDIWKSNQIDEKLTQGFPGRTSALATMLTEKNKGNIVLMDQFAKVPFGTGQRKLAKLEVQKPAWVIAEDFNGDKKPDLLVGTSGGAKLFLAAGDGFEDATAKWGALGSAGGYHATGDLNGDGKPDVMLDGRVWLNDGQKFNEAKIAFGIPTKGTPLGSALLDVNGDQKLDAIFLSSDGVIRVYENPGSEKPWGTKAVEPLWSGGEAPTFAAFGDFGDTGKVHAMVVSASGVTRYALDADGGAPADLLRLTGVDIKKREKFANGLKAPVAVSLSMNGEGRPDVYLFSESNPLLLLNRGLGAFFLDDFTTHGTMKPLAFVPTAASPMARANLKGKGVDDVLILAEDGTLYVLENIQ